jgi:hypothetical protein
LCASLGRGASRAAWNILREANPLSRRVARLYYYVLDDPEHAGEDVALVDDPPSAKPRKESSCVRVPRPLNPSYAVFEMVRDMNRGGYLQVTSEEPVVALATMHEGTLRLMINNNTPERRSVLVALQDIPGRARMVRCRIQRVDEQHSADGRGLERGERIAIQVGKDALPQRIPLPPHATALFTLGTTE